jgi:hypothetical protein
MKKILLAGLAVGLMMLGMVGTVSATSNVALSGTATQSSTGYWNFWATADKAIDGNTNGDYWAGSVSHTNNEFAWWQVDLGQAYSIDQINIFNRTDCCGDRLVPFTLSVLKSNGDVAWSATRTELSGNPLTFSLDDEIGQFVKIQLNTSDWLQLAEVQVFADPVPEPATMLLMGTGLAGLIGARRKKKS